MCLRFDVSMPQGKLGESGDTRRSKVKKLWLSLLVLILILADCATAPTEEVVAPPEEEAAPTEEVAPPPEEEVAPPEAEERTLRISFAWPLFIDPAVGSDYVSSTALATLH